MRRLTAFVRCRTDKTAKAVLITPGLFRFRKMDRLDLFIAIWFAWLAMLIVGLSATCCSACRKQCR